MLSGGALMISGGLEAGRGNRTLVFSLEGYCSTIELHPRAFVRAGEDRLPACASAGWSLLVLGCSFLSGRGLWG